MLISIQENADKLLSNSIDIEFQMSASVIISDRATSSIRIRNATNCGRFVSSYQLRNSRQSLAGLAHVRGRYPSD